MTLLLRATCYKRRLRGRSLTSSLETGPLATVTKSMSGARIRSIPLP